jgi:hypothetical protein
MDAQSANLHGSRGNKGISGKIGDVHIIEQQSPPW